MINTVTMIGNIVRKFDLEETKNGTKMVKFTIAVNDYIKGEGRAYFFDWRAWGSLAERIHKFYGNGGTIAVTGKATQTQKWKKDNGETVWPKVEFWADDFAFANAAPKKGTYMESKQEWKEEQKKDDFMDIPDGISGELPFE